MESKPWRHAGAPALAGLAAGLMILITAGSPRIIGESLFALGLAASSLTLIKKWLTDTSADRERLRHANLNAEDKAQQALVGRALQLAERERIRHTVEEIRRETDRQVAAANSRADQSEINTAMRAHVFEEACEKHYDEKLAAGIAEAQQMARDEIATIRRQLADERSALMISQFCDGVLAERNGEVDEMLAAMEDPKLIRLDDHRRQPPTGKTADGSS